MTKKAWYLLGLSVLVLLVLSAFSTSVRQPADFYLDEEETYLYGVSEIEKCSTINVPFLGKTYAGFKQAVAHRESAGILNLVNEFGYMGKYQFGRSTLRTLGIYDFSQFLKNADWQDKAFRALIERNKWELRNEIEKYCGREINGVFITESGLIAAAHLGGAGSVKKYLHSNGRNGFKDGFGTSIRSYIKKFSGYDLSHIQADSEAVAKL